jgi:hypothetical protein
MVIVMASLWLLLYMMAPPHILVCVYIRLDKNLTVHFYTLLRYVLLSRLCVLVRTRHGVNRPQKPSPFNRSCSG